MTDRQDNTQANTSLPLIHVCVENSSNVYRLWTTVYRQNVTHGVQLYKAIPLSGTVECEVREGHCSGSAGQEFSLADPTLLQSSLCCFSTAAAAKYVLEMKRARVTDLHNSTA